MEETLDKQVPSQSSPRSRVKFWLISILFVVGILGSGFFWIRNLYLENQDAKAIIKTHQEVVNELSRCDTLLGQSQGAFAEYEYCKQFVNEFGEFRP